MGTSQTPDRSEDATFESLKPKTSNWTPPSGKFGSLDYYISKCRSEVNKLNFKHHLVKDNLTLGERAALISLRQRANIVVKPTDKRGTVVVWDRNLYKQEAERQLSDNTFYERLDRDFTMDYNKAVCEVVKEAITKGELPPDPASAVNLVVENPRTSRFYILPKIHQPRNSGRPIVSACNCPTELIARYLDRITPPLIQRLPSYVKDTNHMLQIGRLFSLSWNCQLCFHYGCEIFVHCHPQYGDGLLALMHFLNRRPVLQPPTHTLVRLAELVLTLNTFSLNGNFYRQIGGVADGEAFWDPLMRVCSWGMSRNKSSISTRDQNQPCTKGIAMTSLVPPPEVEKRLKILRPTSTVFIPSCTSEMTQVKLRLGQPQFHLGHFGCSAAFPQPFFEAHI